MVPMTFGLSTKELVFFPNTMSPCPSRSVERGPRTDVRAKVLQAAVQLVHERGLQAVTQARVAEAAGLRQSHVTYYFPARLDLVKAIVQEHVSELLDGVDWTNATSLRKFRDTMIERVKRRESPRIQVSGRGAKRRSILRSAAYGS